MVSISIRIFAILWSFLGKLYFFSFEHFEHLTRRQPLLITRSDQQTTAHPCYTDVKTNGSVLKLADCGAAFMRQTNESEFRGSYMTLTDMCGIT